MSMGDISEHEFRAGRYSVVVSAFIFLTIVFIKHYVKGARRRPQVRFTLFLLRSEEAV
jgi:hypothetical protein